MSDFRQNLIIPAAVLLLGLTIFILMLSGSVIYNKIFFKTSFKTWLSEFKYLLLFYLFTFLMIVIMIFLMFFRFWGIFAGVVAFTTAGGLIANIKNNISFYIEESADYKCTCGKEIVKVFKIKGADGRKLLYYVCRSCGKKYDASQHENIKNKQDNKTD